MSGPWSVRPSQRHPPPQNYCYGWVLHGVTFVKLQEQEERPPGACEPDQGKVGPLNRTRRVKRLSNVVHDQKVGIPLSERELTISCHDAKRLHFCDCLKLIKLSCFRGTKKRFLESEVQADQPWNNNGQS